MHEPDYRSTPFRGGEQEGRSLRPDDVARVLAEALKTVLYKQAWLDNAPKKPDKSYHQNEAFWSDALANQQFPEAYVKLHDFYLTEWIPFAPGRYYTEDATYERQDAARMISDTRDEYLPEGKRSMVRGGIGTIRLNEKVVRGSTLYFLGASSTGIAHQGVPVALSADQYRRVIHIIKEFGGCRATLVGTLRSMTNDMPALHFDRYVPRYCLLAEEVKPGKPHRMDDLLTTVAVMFTSREESYYRRESRGIDPRITNKSWTFCSFHPAPMNAVQSAAQWLIDYAARYSSGSPTLLTDFDEHYRAFRCPVEFPISEILTGQVDWETLKVYERYYGTTHNETYIKEYTQIMGDQINVPGSGNTIINRSVVQNAFNKVKESLGEETANALLRVEAAINQANNRDAAENFESFNEELKKSEPKKSLLKSLWQGTLAALPTLKELPGVIDAIHKLFA